VGVKQDAQEAARWLRDAADGGEVEAQYNLGLMLAVGEGMEQDLGAAKVALRKASEQGHAQALNTLRKLEGL
jgi:hypothetical protein